MPPSAPKHIMEEAIISPKAYVSLYAFLRHSTFSDPTFASLEEAMLKALPSLFSNLPRTATTTGPSPRVEFYDKFQREADDYDRDFVKKYEEDLNTTLIFVRVFCPHIHPVVNLLLRGNRPACSP